jgi:protein-S-isoprenylcysteine O-methyltransferase Ste14
MTEQRYTDPSAPHQREHHLRTPTGELSHEDKLARQALHIRILSLVLILTLLMLAYAAAFDLDSWAEWVVLGGICSVAVGAIIAVWSRNG